MDETLFRRLVGAAVLLLLAFGLASLLPGPDRKESQPPVVAYDLRTGRPLVETVPAPMPPPVKLKPVEIGPEGITPTAPEVTEKPAPPPAKTEEKPEPKPPAKAPADSKPQAPPIKPKVLPGRPALKVDENFGAAGAASWYVQIASFENQANARTVLKKLFSQGMPAMIQSVPAGKKVWYRVRVGPYSSEAPAQQALSALRQQGYAAAKVVRPDAKGN